MRNFLAILCVSLASIACQTRPVRHAATVHGEARLFLYLQPFPREADPLSFNIGAASALRADAPPVPLDLHMKHVAKAENARERLFASGSVPAGRYVGLSLSVETATLRGRERRTELSIPDAPTRIELPFSVGRKRGVVVSLQFDFAASTGDDFAFRPVFHGEIPGQLASGLTGLATSRSFSTVTIFDKISGHVVAVVPTGSRPTGMALARERLRAFVAISGQDSVEVIDIVERTIIDRLRLDGGDAPTELALTPDGATLLSANSGSDSVSFIDTGALFELDRAAVGNGPNSILVDDVGQRAYVFNTRGDSISVLDLPRRVVIATVRTDAEPVRGQLSPDGLRLFVIHRLSPYLLVIDPATLETVNRVYIGGGARALAVDRRTGRIYVGKRGAGIEIYDPASLLPIGNVPADDEVAHVTIDDESNNLFLVLPRSGRVRSIALAGQRTAAEVDVGDEPYWVTLMGER